MTAKQKTILSSMENPDGSITTVFSEQAAGKSPDCITTVTQHGEFTGQHREQLLITFADYVLACTDKPPFVNPDIEKIAS